MEDETYTMEDETYTITPVSMTRQAGIVTGEIPDMPVAERIEPRVTGKLISGAGSIGRQHGQR